MKITIVYDNEAKEGFKNGWGFSCLVEHHGYKVLFDTGWDSNVLLYNMKKLGLQKEDIEIIVLSHNHWDHIGGLAQVIHPDVDVYLPVSFSKRFKNEITKNATVHEVSGPFEIIEGMHLTGELGADIKEQSLIVETGNGILVITGCAHPGLDEIFRAAGSFGKVTGVMGGFHGFDRLERLDALSLIVPCHCTEHKKEIMEQFPEKTKTCVAGHKFKLNWNDEDGGNILTKEKFEFDTEPKEIKRKRKEAQLKNVKVDKTQKDQNWPQAPVELTDHNFNEFVKKYPLLVVDFWAPWCMPCQMVSPVIEELAKDYRGKVVFGKMNIDSEHQIAEKYGIMSIPTILVIKNGKMADQQIGAIPKGILESIIKKQI